MPPINRAPGRHGGPSSSAGLWFTLLAAGLLLASAARAWEHEGSKVAFTEYREGIIEELAGNNRPYFLLFSAEWCHWCHEFGDNTLTDDRVAKYLNENFTSIFIDADIHSAAYFKYRATGLPFTVFLNPDTTPQFRYSGTLYAYDFLTVLQQIKMNVNQGISVESDDAGALSYEPPETLVPAELERAAGGFREGLAESFDPLAHGLGKGEKALYPRTYLYLLSGGEEGVRSETITSIHRAVDRAIERIYDSVEGGFFRYAETRDWQIPHYEKMADLNAGLVLLLFRLNEVSPTPTLVEAADKTLSYLRSTLYDPEIGAFLSFQEADTRYYAAATPEERAGKTPPAVIEKVFLDRLALTVTYLLEVLDYRPDPELERQIVSSLDFVARELSSRGALARYYTVNSGYWTGEGTLQDYALVAQMFLDASLRLDSPRYAALARQSTDLAIARFYDADLGVLTDPSLGDTDDAEFLMEVNGLLAQTLIGLDDSDQYGTLLDDILTYFSGMGDVFEDRLWEGRNWEFTERYVPYLRAADRYL